MREGARASEKYHFILKTRNAVKNLLAVADLRSVCQVMTCGGGRVRAGLATWGARAVQQNVLFDISISGRESARFRYVPVTHELREHVRSATGLPDGMDLEEVCDLN